MASAVLRIYAIGECEDMLSEPFVILEGHFDVGAVYLLRDIYGFMQYLAVLV
jgi:hypothetical protein